MKSTIGLKIAAVAVIAALAGCTDLKPIQAQIDDLKSQVGRLSSDVLPPADRTDATLLAAARGCSASRRQPGAGCSAAAPTVVPSQERSTAFSSVRFRSKRKLSLRRKLRPRAAVLLLF